MLTRLVLVVSLMFLGSSAGASEAANRIALVIGNARYDHIGGLDNPENDAADMSDALIALGFKVFGRTNMTRADMLQQIGEFSDAAGAAEVALFYFAGHAFQFGGENHLLPTDSNPNPSEDITKQSVRLSTILDALEATDGVRLVFLDACRDNPLGISRLATAGGLASVRSSADYVIAYATQPGAGAFDGEGRNGTFTEAVLNHIHTPGQSLADMMIEVRKDVVAATGGQQVPWESSSLTRQFQFDPSPATASEETMFYQLAARAADPNLMSLYLERYPRGAHTAEVVAFLDTSDQVQSVSDAVPASADGQTQSETLWQLALQTRSRDLAETYLEQHPDGNHKEAALRFVASLPRREELGSEQLCREFATHPQDATASVAGVDFEGLSINVETTLKVCRDAVDRNPEQAHFVALLARATIAAGRVAEAVELYQDAAERGDLRALVSLGVLTETGRVGQVNIRTALNLYRRAAEGGSIDGANNLAVALYEGRLVERDETAALELFAQAAADGSSFATFNLGQIALESGAGLDSVEALDYFLRAAQLGEPKGYRVAALLLDRNAGVPVDASRAAELLLLGAAEDRGAIVEGITSLADKWSVATIREMQVRLAQAGLSPGPADGVPGPRLFSALNQWRNGGFDQSVLIDT